MFEHNLHNTMYTLVWLTTIFIYFKTRVYKLQFMNNFIRLYISFILNIFNFYINAFISMKILNVMFGYFGSSHKNVLYDLQRHKTMKLCSD